MAVNIFVTIYVLWQNISAFDLYKCYFVIFKMWFYMRQNCAVTKKKICICWQKCMSNLS